MSDRRAKQVDRWVICFTGFLQAGRISGVETIQDAIHRQCNCDGTRVLLKSWQDSVKDLSGRMWNRRPKDGQPEIVVIGYSYGGWTAVLMTRVLKKLGWNVKTLLLIDPVRRPISWLPSPSSMLSFWKIAVPDNVGIVYEWYQKINKPRGHKVRVCYGTKHVRRRLPVNHQNIDDHPTVFKKALAVACPGMEA